MKISYIECDACGARENIEPPTYGGFPHNWIEVKKTMGGSEDRISAGVSHFCSESCLTRKLTCEALPNKADMHSG